MWLWDLIMMLVLAGLIFVVVGLFVGVPPKFLRGTLLVSLLIVLVRVLWELPPSVVMLSLLLALVLSARLMFFRAP